jgi:hypothetical protein
MRSSGLVLIVALYGCLLAGCGSPHRHEDLSGRWVSGGINCPATVFHTESVEIVQTGTHISATKALGDDYVRAGHPSFIGTVTARPAWSTTGWPCRADHRALPCGTRCSPWWTGTASPSCSRAGKSPIRA